MAVVARSCALRVHAWSHLSHDSLHSSSLATRASLDGRGIGSSNTVTSATDSLSLNIDLDLFAVVDISQSDLNVLDDWFDFDLTFLGSTGSASSHEHAEQIVHASSVGTA